nr:MAG TPA: hypothetical protein [Caudoviricetes sp.]DAW64366.1 MAG TPA: hypothetical protein [Caudoviricetes sp.]
MSVFINSFSSLTSNQKLMHAPPSGPKSNEIFTCNSRSFA